ncbi:MAG: Cna B-type domain-containing protein [Anaerovoracaceae bacterium]
MKKKVFAVFMIVAMLLCFMPSMAFAHTGGQGGFPGGGGQGPHGGQGDGDKYDHIDVRVDGTLTITSKVNGNVIATESVDVKVSNVTGKLNGSDVTFNRKTGQGEENEWRADGLSLTPATDAVVLTCTLSGEKSDGTAINMTVSNTYSGESTLKAFIQKCPGKSGYDIDISAEDLTESFTVDATVTKVWDDEGYEENRPESIQVQMYADEEKYGNPVTLSDDNDWSIKYSDMPKYSSGTTEVVYTVDEESVPDGYEKTVNGFTITNTWITESEPIEEEKTITIPVTKTWDDEGFEGARPKQVVMHLMNDDQVVDTVTLTAENGWKGTFTVPASNAKVDYKVAEEPVDDYTSTVVKQPVAEYFGVSSFGKKVTPASEPKYSFEGDLIVANKGGDYYIWTENDLNDKQKARLIDIINDAEELKEGLGKDLTLRNTSFKSGFHAEFEIGKEEKVSVTKEDETQYIQFSKTNTWSLYYTGVLDIVAGSGAEVKNTYVPEEQTEDVNVTFTKAVLSTNEAEIPFGESGLKFDFQLLDQEGKPLYNAAVEVTKDSKTPSVTFENVPDGTYTLTETAVIGWESSIPEKGITVVVKDGKVTFGDKNDLIVINTYKGTPIEEKKTNVTFTKEVTTIGNLEIPYGDDGMKFDFQLLNDDGSTLGNESAVITAASNSAEVTFENVPDGTYTLTETAVEGWESSIPKEGVTVVVEDGMVTFDSAKTLTVINTWEGTPIEENDTDVTFTKTVLSTNGVEIPYGENGLKFNFQLLKENGFTWGNESAVITAASNSAEVTFKNVPDGTYTLTETAVEGWESSIPEKGITVVVKEKTVTFRSGEQVLEVLAVTNTYKGTDPTDPIIPIIPIPTPDPEGPGEVIVPDPDVPLGPGEVDEPEDPVVIVDEPEVPLDDAPETDVPKTGDNGFGTAGILFFLSAAGLAALAVTGRKKEEAEK